MTSRAVLTIGNFDGVHLGHRELFSRVQALATRSSARAVCLTFRPHPQIALNPAKSLPLLTTYDEKIELIRSLGIFDEVSELAFSREFSNQSPEEFFKSVVLKQVGAKELIIGYDFAFGKDRGGSQAVLAKLCQEFDVKLSIVPAYKVSDQAVSSSRVRALLVAGQMEDANRLLGYPFFYRGRVTRGDSRGREIGFPTANLEMEAVRGSQKLALSHGVYVTDTVIKKDDDIETHRSVTNIGVRPTFALPSPATWIETHLLDFQGDLYGASIEVRFLSNIRAEKKFSGREELHRQIKMDIQSARAFGA